MRDDSICFACIVESVDSIRLYAGIVQTHNIYTPGKGKIVMCKYYTAGIKKIVPRNVIITLLLGEKLCSAVTALYCNRPG